MLWDPFLMKKLLKSVIYGTREQCTGALFTVEKSNVAAKKKKERNVKEQTQTQLSAQSKRALNPTQLNEIILSSSLRQSWQTMKIG